MNMHISAAQLCFLVWASVFVCVDAECAQKERLVITKTVQEKLVAYLNQGRHQAALDVFNNFDWSDVRSPVVVEIYCGALVGSGRQNLPESFVNKAPHHVKSFATAYVLLLSGKTESAISKFELLRKHTSEQSKIWAELGLLEVSIYTDNLLFSIEPLGALIKSIGNNASPELKEEFQFFKANSSFRNSDFSNAAKLLRETTWNYRQIDANVMQLQLLLRDNLFDEVRVLTGLNRPSMLLDFRLMRAKLALNEEGIGKYEKQLQALRAEFAKNVEIQVDFLSSKLFRGNDGEKTSALTGLLAIYKKEQSNYPLSLYVANLLFDYGTSEIEEVVRRTIRNGAEPPINFSRYYLLEAKIYRRSKQFAVAMSSLDQAIAMAPTNLEILREGYLLALDRGASSEARDWLKRSLVIEPYSVDITTALIDLEASLGNFAAVKDLTAGLKANRRYIDSEIWNYISSRSADSANK